MQTRQNEGTAVAELRREQACGQARGPFAPAIVGADRLTHYYEKAAAKRPKRDREQQTDLRP